MAITFSGTVYPWNSAQDIALLCLLGIVSIALGIHLSNSCNTAVPSSLAYDYLFFIGSLAAFTMLNGHPLARSGYSMPWYVTGSALVIAANGMLYNCQTVAYSLSLPPSNNTLAISASNSFIYAAMVLNGIGTGMFLNPPFAVAQWLAPPKETSSAVGFIRCARGSGLAIALSIANAIFLNLA
ncbi:hypothetical protein BDV96DRAFT_671160 [Lophiotrema nucula]|uniref:Major facilitator superfamily domain-containing protein n=1 Tax=Lophiotrema nucula TaxID=690887 RepID=A0A6A5YRA1_9PLEO|nr:hypothetical protein BDV96DRAFT_671160 [Lophiotrema nucula]